MTIQTIQLQLKPDPEIPEIRRLHYQRVEVSLEDVFQQGIHPHSAVATHDLPDQSSAAAAIIKKLNEDDAYVPNLKAHAVGYEVTEAIRGLYFHDGKPCLERQLTSLAANVGFMEDLDYEQLLKLAEQQLRRVWDQRLAREFLNNVGRGFAGMRDLLKSKDPAVAVGSYEDINQMDLARLLSVDDFLAAEQLVLQYGLPFRNFRRASSLGKFTDGQGRIRMTDRITRCQVRFASKTGIGEAGLVYHCEVKGQTVRWIPSLSDDAVERRKARRLARCWGQDKEIYCFTSTLADMAAIVAQEKGTVGFPDLDYQEQKDPSVPEAGLRHRYVACYDVSISLHAGSTNEAIKYMLGQFQRKQTGRKEDLVVRLAELVADEYARSKDELDRYFTEHQFIRLANAPAGITTFPVLQQHELKSQIVTLYCLRHMRGNVVLGAGHENNTVSLADMAAAMLQQTIRLTGAFVPVV